MHGPLINDNVLKNHLIKEEQYQKSKVFSVRLTVIPNFDSIIGLDFDLDLDHDLDTASPVLVVARIHFHLFLAVFC